MPVQHVGRPPGYLLPLIRLGSTLASRARVSGVYSRLRETPAVRHASVTRAGEKNRARRRRRWRRRWRRRAWQDWFTCFLFGLVVVLVGRCRFHASNLGLCAPWPSRFHSMQTTVRADRRDTDRRGGVCGCQPSRMCVSGLLQYYQILSAPSAGHASKTKTDAVPRLVILVRADCCPHVPCGTRDGSTGGLVGVNSQVV
eukprot:4953316-Prymnesium_polylepis.2